jgi:MarR family transcriptional regulator, 2-MHQ and catechol-resistance regulon repressor
MTSNQEPSSPIEPLPKFVSLIEDEPPSLTLTHQAAQEPVLGMVRDLVHTYQAFYTSDEHHIRTLGLTVPQFDVLCTLGNTAGMMMSQIAEKTLVTKGTLTGIVDRLEQKGLVQREVPPENRRCFIIVLTPDGKALFEAVFPKHVAFLKERCTPLSTEEIQQIRACLLKLRRFFE